MLNRDEDYVDVITYIQPGPGTGFSWTANTAYSRSRERHPASGTRRATGSSAASNSSRDLEEMPIGSGLRGRLQAGLHAPGPCRPRTEGRFRVRRRSQCRDGSDEQDFAAAFLFPGFSVLHLLRCHLLPRDRLSGRACRNSCRGRPSLSYDVSFGRAVYPRDGDIQGRGDRFVAHAVSLNLRLARHLGVVLMGTFGQRARDGGGTTRDRYFIGLSLIYGFPGSGCRLRCWVSWSDSPHPPGGLSD